jgi:carbon monoxide dehydrogenase subunit G
MARYESKIKVVNALTENVYRRLSDLSGLQTLKDNMSPEVKEQLKAKLAEDGGGKVHVSNVSFDCDHARFTVNGMATSVSIIDREENKCVKLSADNSPVPFTLWIQTLPESAYTTKLRVTIDVDIPFFLRPMVGSKLDGAADMIAEALTKIPY